MSAVKGFEGQSGREFTLDLTDTAMRHFVSRYRTADLSNDHVFHASLRWLYAMYSFLGGERFQRDLAVALGTSDSSVSRWVKGQSVPAGRLRRKSVRAAFDLVTKARQARERGIDLFEGNHSDEFLPEYDDVELERA